MNSDSPARFVLATALLINAAAAFWIYSSLPMQPGRGWTLYAAAGFAVFIAALAAAAVFKPEPLVLVIARALALDVIVVLVGVALLFWLADTMNLNSSSRTGQPVLYLVVGGAVQGAILVSAAAVEDKPLLGTTVAAIGPGFLVWFGALGFHFAVGFVAAFF